MFGTVVLTALAKTDNRFPLRCLVVIAWILTIRVVGDLAVDRWRALGPLSPAPEPPAAPRAKPGRPSTECGASRAVARSLLSLRRAAQP